MRTAKMYSVREQLVVQQRELVNRCFAELKHTCHIVYGFEPCHRNKGIRKIKEGEQTRYKCAENLPFSPSKAISQFQITCQSLKY